MLILLTGHGAGAAGASIDAPAIAVVLAQPWAHVVLSGAVTEEQLRSNLRARDLEIGAAARDEFVSVAEPAEAYWRARASRPWG